MTSLTVSGSVNTTSLIAGGDIPCAESNTTCARRHVTTDPDARLTIRSSRLPSSLVISRNCTLAAIVPPGRVAISTQGLRRQHHHPSLSKPANVAGEPTSSTQVGQSFHSRGYRGAMSGCEAICGDAVELMAQVRSESVDLIYIDPPFGTGSTRSARQRGTGVTTSFGDCWTGAPDY